MNMFPWHLMLVTLAGWANQHQLKIIEYQQEEIRVLRELHGKRRLRFTDDQRHRLAAKGKRLGRKLLREFATIVKPDTILRWHHTLIARKWDYASKRGPGRPRISSRIRQLVVRFDFVCRLLTQSTFLSKREFPPLYSRTRPHR